MQVLPLDFIKIAVKVQVGRISYFLFLSAAIVVYLTFSHLPQYILEFKESVVANTLVLILCFAWLHATNLDVRRVLKLEKVPAAQNSAAVILANYLTFLPFQLFTILGLSQIDLQLFLFAILITTLLTLEVLGLKFSFPLSIAVILAAERANLISADLAMVSLGIIFAPFLIKIVVNLSSKIDRALLLWFRIPISIIHPVFAAFIILPVLSAICLISKSTDMAIWISPVGGGVIYTYNEKSTMVYFAGGAVVALSLLLSLAVSMLYTGVRYIDSHIWRLLYLRGNPFFSANLFANVAFGILLTFFVFSSLNGLGKLNGLFFTASVSTMLSVALAVKLDDGKSIGSFLFYYFTTFFVLSSLIDTAFVLDHEKELLLASLAFSYLIYIVWFRLRILLERSAVGGVERWIS